MAGIQNMQLMQINFASTSVVSNLLCVEPFDPPMQNTINTLTVCVHALQWHSYDMLPTKCAQKTRQTR